MVVVCIHSAENSNFSTALVIHVNQLLYVLGYYGA